MTIQTIPHNGHIVISDIIAGYLITRVYIGHNKRDAIRLFKREARQ